MMKHDNRQKTNRSRLGSLLMKAGAAGLLFLMAQSSAWAAYNISYCTSWYDRELGDPPANVTIPISGEAFMGAEFETNIYLLHSISQFINGIVKGYSCRKIVGNDLTPIPLTQHEKTEIVSAPLGYPTIRVIYGRDTNVFPTNVPGIGVSFIQGGMDDFSLPGERIGFQAGTKNCTDYNICSHGYAASSITIYLHRIGDIPPGSHFIDATSFPTFAVYSGALEHPPLDNFLTFSFTGGIHIVSKTCDTSNVTVELGEHEKSYFATNEGSPWVDFNIELTNCPAFLGRNYYAWSQSTGDTALYSSKKNEFSYILKPTTALSGSTTVLLDGTPGSAEGIGVQVEGPDGGKTFNYEYPINGIINSPSSVEGLSYNIPFKARYVRLGSNASNIKPGTANTAVEFVINYK